MARVVRRDAATCRARRRVASATVPRAATIHGPARDKVPLLLTEAGAASPRSLGVRRAA